MDDENKRNSKYDWDKWFERLGSVKSGRITLKNPTHYQCADHGMAVQVRRAAIKRKLKVGVEIGDNCLHLIHKG